jgi:hypothetical protein
MKISRQKYCVGLAVVFGALLGMIFFAPYGKAADDPAKAEQPAAAAIPAGQARAPKLPAYFTATNEDPKKPAWPDPTGAATVCGRRQPLTAKAIYRIN